MCGIVAAVSGRNIVPVLVQGLQRLEYRGYDSCGVAVHAGGLKRARSTARVAELMQQVAGEGLTGTTGIAHTRWATHGAPSHSRHPSSFSEPLILKVRSEKWKPILKSMDPPPIHLSGSLGGAACQIFNCSSLLRKRCQSSSLGVGRRSQGVLSSPPSLHQTSLNQSVPCRQRSVCSCP